MIPLLVYVGEYKSQLKSVHNIKITLKNKL